MADNKKYEGYDYKDFKSEEYIPTLIEAIINKFMNFDSKKKTAHENINKLIEGLDDSRFEKIARKGDGPSLHGDFIDIYRILNPDSTINIQGIPGYSEKDVNLSRDDMRALNSQISLKNLINQLKENPNKPSMTKNELAEFLSSYNVFPVDEYYLDRRPRNGFFLNKQ